MAGGKTFKRDQKRRKEMARKLKQEEKLRRKQARKDEGKSSLDELELNAEISAEQGLFGADAAEADEESAPVQNAPTTEQPAKGE
jgi:hypothetical protein